MNRYTACGTVLVLLLTCALSFAKGGLRSSSALANTTQAREFYITFPTNLFEQGIPNNVLDLTCFIASNYNTKGTIQLLGTGNTIIWQQNFAVDAQSVTQIGIPHQYNNQAEIQDAEDERAITKAVHITTDMPCVVYGMSHRPFTADGYLAIPPSSWGTDYRIGGYYGVSTTSEAALTKLDVTSELAVVAAQDSTVVNIILSAPTRDITNNMTHRAGDLVSVILNKGQIYQMQSYSDPGGGNYYDLSMTEIQSSKPVGVFGGSKCANVPVAQSSCDYVIEMMPPIQSWGKEFFTYQFDPARKGGDLWRVYPSQNNTTITINGNKKATISPSDTTSWYETDDLRDSSLKNPAHWTFNKPVMMMQYITGEQYDGSDQLNPPRGDPSSVVLESPEQFHTNIFCALPSDSNGYTNQYLNVFINNGLGPLSDSLYIDGHDIQHLPGAPYALLGVLQVPNTNYWVLHIQVPGGMHRLQSKNPFSAYAVGFKIYESYAWPCGLSLNVLGTGDTKPPVLTNNALDCGTLNDTLTDQPDVDSIRSNLAQPGDDSSGIGWVHQGPYPDTTYNFNDAVLPLTFTPGDSTTQVHIQVTDLRNKAHGAFYA
ncbi:MAG TPA: IgGFc-binding protein, partial [Candidatus Kapabacteria bacterium]|nr:IgGFc-binding protein [Candidatus Kapabacteria bacterium]